LPVERGKHLVDGSPEARSIVAMATSSSIGATLSSMLSSSRV
jgi:hypothetical protein